MIASRCLRGSRRGLKRRRVHYRWLLLLHHEAGSLQAPRHMRRGTLCRHIVGPPERLAAMVLERVGKGLREFAGLGGALGGRYQDRTSTYATR